MSLDPVIIAFTTAGLPQVERAFATVEQQIARMERSSTQASDRGAKTRVRTAQGEAKDRERAAEKIKKDADRLEKQHTRDVEAETKRRAAIVRKSSEMAGQFAKQQAKADARAEAEKTRNIERETERRSRIQIRSSEMAGRYAARQAAEEISQQNRAAGLWGQRGRKVGGVITGSVGRTLGGMASIASMGMGIGGGMLVADAARREMAAGRTAALLVNAGTTNGVAPGTVSQAISAAREESIRTGTSSGDLLQGALTYSQNARGGDFKGALANMGFFAKMSRVTGAGIDDIAQAAGTLQSQNAELGAHPEQMQQLLMNTLAQAHQGSMSMVDAAKQFGMLGSTRSSFAGDVTQNQQTLIGLGQIAKSGGDAQESGTFIKDIALEASKADAKFFKDTKKTKGVGEHLFKTDQFGRMEGPEQLVTDIFRKTKGNIQDINGLMGIRGGALFRELGGAYVKGAGPKNDVEAGIKAVQENIRSVTGSTMSVAELNKQDNLALDQPGEKFHRALNQITETIEAKLEPGMARLADKMPYLVEKFTAVVDAATSVATWMTDSWPQTFVGVGAIVGAVLAKDLASEAVTDAVKAGFTKLFMSAAGGGGGGGPLPTPGGGVPATGGPSAFNKLGAALGIAGAAYNVYDAATSSVSGYAEGQKSGASKAAELLAGIKSGKVSAADVSKAMSGASAGSVAAKSAEITAAQMDRFVTGGLATKAAGTSLGQLEGQRAEMIELRKHSGEFIAALAAMTAKINSGAIASNTAPGNPALHVPIGSASR